jgi:hypothetical protein
MGSLPFYITNVGGELRDKPLVWRFEMLALVVKGGHLTIAPNVADKNMLEIIDIGIDIVIMDTFPLWQEMFHAFIT